MHLAACFQTNQHVREARSPSSTCGEQTAPDCGGATRIQMHMFTFPEHLHTAAFSDARGGGEEKTFGSESQGKCLCKQGSLCGGEESARPGQPDARPAVLSLPGCVHTSAALIGTQTLSFSLTHSLKYFKQNASNFLFLKLSCISNGIPSDPGE